MTIFKCKLLFLIFHLFVFLFFRKQQPKKVEIKEPRLPPKEYVDQKICPKVIHSIIRQSNVGKPEKASHKKGDFAFQTFSTEVPVSEQLNSTAPAAGATSPAESGAAGETAGGQIT